MLAFWHPLALSILIPAQMIAAPAESTDCQLLVLDVQVHNLKGASSENLTSQLAAEVARVSSHQARTLADLRDVLSHEESKQIFACDDATCLAELLGAANADLLLRSSLGQIGASLVLNLSLIDAKNAAAISQSTSTGGSIDESPDMIREAVASLLGVDATAAGPRYSLPEGKEVSFAVFDLRASGMATEVVQNLTQILSVAIKRIDNTSVVSRDDIRAMLDFESNKAMLGCSEATCLAEIGGALGVDKLIAGDVGKLADRYIITLRLIDARDARVDNRISESFRGDEEQLIRAIRFASRRLLGVQADSDANGKLVVNASQSEAEVFLNQQPVGQLPLPPIADLPPGRHTLRLSKSGYLEWQSDFYVDPSETTSVWAELQQGPKPWYEEWWVWTVAGVVVAGATTISLYAALREPPPATGNVGIQP